MKKLLCLTCLMITNAFGLGTYTTIESGVTLYSEYYPNTQSKFKGTIIFENGSGTDLKEWTKNKQFLECAKHAGSVFLYDRSGLGKSSPNLYLSGENPITGKLITDQLLKLLKQRDIKPPYVFVAHSYGVMHTGYFALKYPELVQGLLLVDPVPKSFHFSAKLITSFESAITAARKDPATDIYKKFGGPEAEVAYGLLGFDRTKQELADLGAINDKIPVVIISSTAMEKDQPLKEDWYKSQKQWLNQNPKSKIVVLHSSHFIQLKYPKYVCGQIRALTTDE